VSPHAVIEGAVYIAPGAKVEPTAYIKGPCIIGPDTEVRHGAYIRGNVFVGKGCVVGHATEVKSSVFLDGAKAGHFAYVGDSILGPGVNLGAGTKLANLKLKKNEVRLEDPDTGKFFGTGLKKFGAVIGRGVQVGCNAVLSPGTLLLPGALVTPCAHIIGTKGKGIHS
jgi:NDP-sugar pyrophosphorylase family protein